MLPVAVCVHASELYDFSLREPLTSQKYKLKTAVMNIFILSEMHLLLWVCCDENMIKVKNIIVVFMSFHKNA